MPTVLAAEIQPRLCTTIVYRDYIGNTLGLYWENRKENGNYYLGVRVYLKVKLWTYCTPEPQAPAS